MINVILNSNAFFKLKLVAFLLANGNKTVSIRKISLEFDCSYSKIQTALDEIVQDLYSCYQREVVDITEGIRIIEPTFQYNTYKQFLIQQSIPYQIVQGSLIEPEKNLEDFCRENFISRATINRQMRPLMKYVQRFGVRLNLSSMEWFGDERSIRTLIFNLLWLGSHEREVWKSYGQLFEKEEQLIEELEITKSNYIDNNEVFLILVISRLRTEQQHLLRDQPFTGLVFPELNKFMYSYLTDFSHDKEQLELQLEYLGYMIIYAPYYLCEEDERLTYVDQYFIRLKEEKHPLAGLLLDFEAYYQQELLPENVPLDSQHLLRTNIFTTLLNFSIKKAATPVSTDFFRDYVIKNNRLYQELFNKLMIYFRKAARRKHFGWLSKCLPSLVDLVTFNLLPYYEHRYDQNKLVIGLVSGNNYLTLQDVKNFLNQFTFLDIRLVTEDQEDLDFLVTTFPKVIKSVEKPTFTVDSTQHFNYQPYLFERLQTAYKEKQLKLV